MNEIRTLRAMKGHENIIKLHAVYETEENINMVFEHFDEGDLHQRVLSKGPLSEKNALHILTQVLEGIQYLHEKRVVHRDIKPNNIFIRCDF